MVEILAPASFELKVADAMFRRLVAAVPLVCAMTFSVQAHDPQTIELPTLALDPRSLNPHSFEPSASPWSGFSIGSEISALSRKGAEGLAGGSAFLGYNHEFYNQVVLGVEASSGFVPSLLSPSLLSPRLRSHGSARGFDFAATSVKLGYNMGRLMPFVTAGVTLAKPQVNRGVGFVNATESVNDLFNSPSHVATFGTIGAGFDYALTNDLSVGLTVSTNRGSGFRSWP
jgi:outer membrane immunogenic protein